MEMEIEEFCDINQVPDQMFWKSDRGAQIEILLDLRAKMLAADPHAQATVISYHTSKSIKLPVVRFNCPSLGFAVTTRNNFYNWAVSVSSDNELHVEGLDLAAPEPTCFEGFKRAEAPIYGEYEPGCKEFSCFLWNTSAKRIGILLDVLVEGTDERN